LGIIIIGITIGTIVGITAIMAFTAIGTMAGPATTTTGTAANSTATGALGKSDRAHRLLNDAWKNHEFVFLFRV
jgi:hypothetical protein